MDARSRPQPPPIQVVLPAVTLSCMTARLASLMPQPRHLTIPTNRDFFVLNSGDANRLGTNIQATAEVQLVRPVRRQHPWVQHTLASPLKGPPLKHSRAKATHTVNFSTARSEYTTPLFYLREQCNLRRIVSRRQKLEDMVHFSLSGVSRLRAQRKVTPLRAAYDFRLRPRFIAKPTSA